MSNPLRWLRDLAVKEDGDQASRLKLVGYCVGATIVAVVLWKVPQRQAHQPKEQFAQENAARTTLAQILGGAVLLGSLYTSLKTFGLSRQGHITDRFTKAIEQLGKMNDKEPNIEVRLGAIYALERIALDSPRDHWTIMEILTAYVRENAPLDPDRPYTQGEKPSTDIQAILTVLGRRKFKRDPAGKRLDLSKTRLCGATLYKKAYLQGAFLQEANLQEAGLEGIYLQEAYLRLANLKGANLREANLQKATFWESDLREASLQRAELQGAFLREAYLQGANLEKAYLQGAYWHSANQIKSARGWMFAHYSQSQRAELGIPPESGEVKP